MKENREYSVDEAEAIAAKVGLAALKYGDLSNQASKDYIFDIERGLHFQTIQKYTGRFYLEQARHKLPPPYPQICLTLNILSVLYCVRACHK